MNDGVCKTVASHEYTGSDAVICCCKSWLLLLHDTCGNAVIEHGWGNAAQVLGDNCIYGETRFLYLSPERLGSDVAQARIQRMPVNLIAVDEAHCISQWGYDFRPPYLEIARIREWMPQVPVRAAAAQVRAGSRHGRGGEGVAECA